ncbi:hypothetical protein DUNSADRAFT_2242 [Dunaliella salina]|uniref:Encoded protein n=1 Tax=Dunaliella salina TaxID=3046 RepID=A0ABQ7GVY7_DUNSA|nr:hypothetical protein DUNSADRAFT_2242 [Dunaliella salina]|eukprot:KAF5838779.1 hypothetical protein DUNSADRAFT_2242 [Dunaliella salina]
MLLVFVELERLQVPHTGDTPLRCTPLFLPGTDYSEDDGNLLNTYSQIWTSTEDKIFAELSYVDSGCFEPILVSMFPQGLLSKDMRLRDKEEELKADQRRWLFGLAVLQLQEGQLPLPMDKPLWFFSPLTLLLNQLLLSFTPPHAANTHKRVSPCTEPRAHLLNRNKGAHYLCAGLSGFGVCIRSMPMCFIAT